MAEASITGDLLTVTARINYLNDYILGLQSQKNLALYSQQDLSFLQQSEITELRHQFRDMFDSDIGLQETYVTYAEIPDFEEQLNIITAKYEKQMDELTGWETIINQQITTASAELEEAKIQRDSYKTTLTANIQVDYAFGLDQ